MDRRVKYQKEHAEKGLCHVCSAPSVQSGRYCNEHGWNSIVRKRAKVGYEGSNKGRKTLYFDPNRSV